MNSALTRPARLLPGDRVALVAPSGPVSPRLLAAGTALLRDWGLDPVSVGRVTAGHPRLDYLAAPDEQRAADFRRAWCDRDVRAVFAVRGGYGAQRMVDLLDWDALREAGPKVFVGFSDLTVLHEALAVRLGLATVHGPMPGTAAFVGEAAGAGGAGGAAGAGGAGATANAGRLRRLLFTPQAVGSLTSPAARALVPGRAAGVTLGGCVSLLAAELGTPGLRPSAAGGILVLEDTGMEPYQLDRALTQLLRAGWLDGVAGIALGSWHACGPYQPIRAVLRDRLAPLGVPVVEELGFGHGPTTGTVPLGVPAVLDADAATLSWQTPALAERAEGNG